MERTIAIKKLKELEGVVLQELASQYEVTISGENGKINKGWAGHAIERHLGLPINSAQSPNFGSCELKSIPLKRLKNGYLSFKETMAITMIDPFNVKNTSFEDSHLLSKLRKMVIVAREAGVNTHAPSVIHSINVVDLNAELYTFVKSDYEIVQNTLLDSPKGFGCLTGKMGLYI